MALPGSDFGAKPESSAGEHKIGRLLIGEGNNYRFFPWY